jgi:hypothetical protein
MHKPLDSNKTNVNKGDMYGWVVVEVECCCDAASKHLYFFPYSLHLTHTSSIRNIFTSCPSWFQEDWSNTQLLCWGFGRTPSNLLEPVVKMQDMNCLKYGGVWLSGSGGGGGVGGEHIMLCHIYWGHISLDQQNIKSIGPYVLGFFRPPLDFSL